MNDKPMTTGQKALYEIAVDPDRTKKFLINLEVLRYDMRQRNIITGAFILLAFIAGFVFGKA